MSEDSPIVEKKVKSPVLDTGEILALIETALDEDQADDVKVISLAGKANFADYMVIASGASRRKVDSMAVHIQTALKKLGVTWLTVEGRTTGDWVLVDAGPVIVHLFRPEIRAYYDLERLWEHDLTDPMRSETESATV